MGIGGHTARVVPGKCAWHYKTRLDASGRQIDVPRTRTSTGGMTRTGCGHGSKQHRVLRQKSRGVSAQNRVADAIRVHSEYHWPARQQEWDADTGRCNRTKTSEREECIDFAYLEWLH